MIYFIGNSHANLFTNTECGIGGKWNVKGNFASYSLGATCAYDFREYSLPKIKKILSRLVINKNRGHLCLVVGETDVRLNIPLEAIKQNKSLEDMTYESLDRFWFCIEDLNRDYNMIVWSSHPSSRYNGNNEANSNEPVFYDCATRNRLSRIWRDELKERSKQQSIPMVDILDEMIDESGLTVMSPYFMDFTHLNYNIVFPMVMGKFREIGII